MGVGRGVEWFMVMFFSMPPFEVLYCQALIVKGRDREAMVFWRKLYSDVRAGIGARVVIAGRPGICSICFCARRSSIWYWK